MNPKRHTVLHVNGEERDVLAQASMTLLEALREQLGLTGTKRGCPRRRRA
ncbi:MAG TPA: hypothetical protein VM489_06865 [Burkholderiales bacterium]|nr:hypothetical protein [Burkholderiales bacterium]